jgi:hypothetical protein
LGYTTVANSKGVQLFERKIELGVDMSAKRSKGASRMIKRSSAVQMLFPMVKTVSRSKSEKGIMLSWRTAHNGRVKRATFYREQ